MRLLDDQLGLKRYNSFEKIDLSDTIRRVERLMSTGSYEEAICWIDRLLKDKVHSQDKKSIDQLLNLKVQIILVQAELVIASDPVLVLKYCKEAFLVAEKINEKDNDYMQLINPILQHMYDLQIQNHRYRNIYKLLWKSKEITTDKESLFAESNFLAKKLIEGLQNAKEIEAMWEHKWRRKLRIMRNIEDRYFHKERELDQVRLLFEKRKDDFYYSPDLHRKEHPYRKVNLIYYNNEFCVAKDRIIQEVLGTRRVIERKVYEKSKVALRRGV